jgi:hypothetical protein
MSFTVNARAMVDLPAPGQAGEEHGEALAMAGRIGLAQFLQDFDR